MVLCVAGCTAEGTGVLVLESTAVDVGPVFCGTSETRTLAVRNDGDGRLRTTIASSLEGVTVAPAALDLEPGQRIELAIEAVVPGISIPGHVSSGHLTFTGDTGELATVPVSFAARGAVLRHDPRIDFGTMFPGTRRVRDLTLAVDGTDELRVTLGEVPAPFASTGAAGTLAIAPATTAQLGFTLDATATQQLASPLPLAVDGPLCGPPPRAPSLVATVDEGLLSLDRTAIDFGTIRCGDAARTLHVEAHVADGLVHDYTAFFSSGDLVSIGGVLHATDLFHMFTMRRSGQLDGPTPIAVTAGALRGSFATLDLASPFELRVDDVVERLIGVNGSMIRPFLRLPFSNVGVAGAAPGEVITHTFSIINEGSDAAQIITGTSPGVTVSPSAFVLQAGSTAVMTMRVLVTAGMTFPVHVGVGDGCGPDSGVVFSLFSSVLTP